MAGGASDNSDESITGINVTPLVDITLVLLIIFMVTAKLIVSKSVPLDLPKAASGSDIQTVFSIVLAADGTTQIDSKTVPNDDVILASSKAAHEKNPELRAIIKADSAVPHGRVIHVLDLLKQAQVGKIAFGVSPVAPGIANPAPAGGAGGGGGGGGAVPPAPPPAPAPAPPK
jgi:biopolymer transport protein ExbD